jgi:hypothetical protein
LGVSRKGAENEKGATETAPWLFHVAPLREKIFTAMVLTAMVLIAMVLIAVALTAMVRVFTHHSRDHA